MKLYGKGCYMFSGVETRKYFLMLDIVGALDSWSKQAA
jgi:hypothetical protein